jgi:hypothetical protein
MHHRRLIRLSIAAVAALGFYFYRDMQLTERRKTEFRDACSPVIAWAETRRQLDGRYPAVPPPELQQVLERLGPPAKYRALEDGQSFAISIGNYSLRYSWKYYYMPHTGWGTDS